ncbi:MAG: hypothetical protein K9N22_09610 [Candidatus Marinimicrobia bacterium]|nr:hypothetical protein [Candidatus Neomarinimicrobiota bacterium]MCF7841018.1 hypothetical protein [Candidatus Neomarinimicrobiota bacterium]
MKDLAKDINPNWYSITIINLLVLGILMLFMKELPASWKSYLLPALMIHTLGTGLIGYCQGAMFRSKGMKDDYKDPVPIFIIAYAVWFILLIAYFVFRGIL